MILALRRDPPSNANLLGRLFSWVIKTRLVSLFCHGGIVIDGVLYHSTLARGPHKMQPGEWSPDKWDLRDVGGDDAQAIAEFEAACTPPEGWWRKFWWKITKGYDVFSLLAFVGPGVRVAWLHYCFELCYRMMTGRKPTSRITAEILLLAPLVRAQPGTRLEFADVDDPFAAGYLPKLTRTEI
jgi:hypothetical protein